MISSTLFTPLAPKQFAISQKNLKQEHFSTALFAGKTRNFAPRLFSGKIDNR